MTAAARKGEKKNGGAMELKMLMALMSERAREMGRQFHFKNARCRDEADKNEVDSARNYKQL